jgi:hypothetical protein
VSYAALLLSALVAFSCDDVASRVQDTSVTGDSGKDAVNGKDAPLPGDGRRDIPSLGDGRRDTQGKDALPVDKGKPTGSVYYVSNSGLDNNTGTQTSPWKTIAKVNATKTFKAGDWILFERGGTWRETLVVPSSGTATAYLTFGNYGSSGSRNPRILGSTQLSGWTNVTGNIWKSSTTVSDPNTSPEQANIFFEGTSGVSWGIRKTSQSSLTAEHQWTWASNAVSIYSTSDPGTKYTSVEVPQRGSAVHMNTKQYVHFDGIDMFYTRWSAYGYDWQHADMVESFGLVIESSEIGYLGTWENDLDIGYGIELVYTDMTIRNNKIHDCGRRSIALDIYGKGYTAKNIVIEGNTFYNGYHTTGIDINSGAGGYTASIDGVTVRNNLFYEVPGRAAADYSELLFIQNFVGSTSVGNVYIYNNIFKNPNGYGILMEGIKGMVYIYHNDFYGFNTAGIAHISVQNNGQDSHATIKNNIFFTDTSTSKAALETYGGQSLANVIHDYNLYQNVQSKIGAGSNSVTGTPLFVSTASDNFHLQTNSPAINKGTNVGIATDRDGKARVGAPDIGAYEY